jgi:hypothetical protein
VTPTPAADQNAFKTRTAIDPRLAYRTSVKIHVQASVVSMQSAEFRTMHLFAYALSGMKEIQQEAAR